MFQSKITRISLGITLTFLSVMWTVFFLDYYFELNLYVYGVKPRTLSGLLGVITAPFLHSTRDFSHIINNSVPFLVLGWMLFYHYRTIAARTFLFIFLFTGIATWAFAKDAYHIGMSGVIYGLTSFLVTSGFYRKNMRVAAISMVVIFLYGSTVWGIFPNHPNVSWEGHAYGLIAGVAIAFFYRKSGPQPKKHIYEIEEEMGIEPEDEYWKVQDKPAIKRNEPRIIVNYHVVPREVKVEKEEDPED